MSPNVRGRYGVETSTFWPAYPGIVSVAGTVRLWHSRSFRGDLVLAPFWSYPKDRDDEGRFSSLELNVGYRQYFVRGLFAEATVSPGLGTLDGSVYTKRDYQSFDIEVAAVVGYRLDVVGPLYLSLSLGTRYVAYKSNPWPLDDRGSTTDTPIFAGDLRLGLSFH